jgi:hypothetical protein
MGFNTEIIYDFPNLSTQKTKSMKLHQRPHSIYTLDEIEFQLTCSSDNQKILAVEGSKIVPIATHGKMEEP